MSDKKIEENQSHVPFVAGLLGGGAGIIVGHPLDTVKTIQQVHTTAAGQDVVKRTLTTPMWRVAAQVCAQNGLSGFFRGLTYPLAMNGAISAVYFGAMEWTKQKLCIDPSKATYAQVYTAGVMGGVAQLPLVVPAEVVKVQLQAQLKPGGHNGNQVGSLRHTMRILEQQGIRGLYRGTVVTAARDVPTYGIYIVTFEFVKVHVHQALGVEQVAAAELIAGGSAGVICWTVATPMDVIKSRIQANEGQTKLNARAAPVDSGMWQVAVGVYREAGVRGFAKGLPAIVTRAFITNAVTFYGYMAIIRWFGSV